MYLKIVYLVMPTLLTMWMGFMTVKTVEHESLLASINAEVGWMKGSLLEGGRFTYEDGEQLKEVIDRNSDKIEYLEEECNKGKLRMEQIANHRH